MHYIDEGPRDGRPVVMVHGNPTWGYLYRKFVGPLVEAGHRAIVPDHLGFGRSDKPPRPKLYRIAQHVRRLDALLESLDLHGAVVVPQDWGGPIGLSWAVAHPDRVAGLFILNTYAHRPPGKVPLPLPLRLFRTPGVGEVMVKGLGFFHRVFLFRVGVMHRDRLEQGLEAHFRDRPVRIMWAMKAPAFTPQVLDQLWLRTFPDAEVTRLDDAGHYLQEDAHERIVPELLRFLGELP